VIIDQTSAASPPSRLPAGPTLPRLLSAVGVQSGGAVMPLATHRLTYPAPPLARRQPIESSIAAVEQAGLRGRGGGGFPTGRKMRTVSTGRGRPIVVVNGSEGEPASGKDALLLTRAPHLVLDGALHAAAAIGATEVIVCIESTKLAAIRSIEAALSERIRAREPMVPVHVQDLPPRYVAGEETALVHLLNGGEARPTMTPPRPFERGVDGRPTLIDNVETLCHLAQIQRWGPMWFRGQGTPEEPGTMLLTLSGAVERSGVCEVPIGMSLHRLLSSSAPTADIGAVLLGGYYGSWIGEADVRRATLDNAHLRTIGSGLGCGAVIALPTSACGLAETARILTWLAGETAGQCGPCVHGLAAIAGGMRELATGRASVQTVGNLHRWADQVEGRGACSFPDGAVRLLRSALRTFNADVARHLNDGPCQASTRPAVLRIPAHRAPAWR
jgi:NADH:ubiquinone oxidoreductase subunit F (NADH-binding)